MTDCSDSVDGVREKFLLDVNASILRVIRGTYSCKYNLDYGKANGLKKGKDQDLSEIPFAFEIVFWKERKAATERQLVRIEEISTRHEAYLSQILPFR